MKRAAILISGIFLCLVGTLGWFHFERAQLKHFCDSIKVGEGLLDVRVDAEEQGYRAVITPNLQMQIRNSSLQLSRLHCRVFFNQNYETVEYRAIQ